TKGVDQSSPQCTGNQVKSVEQEKHDNRLNNQTFQRKMNQSDGDCQLQTDNSHKLTIDNDYEVDTLTLARDGGILDWDDRVADVLDDRELVSNEIFFPYFISFFNNVLTTNFLIVCHYHVHSLK
ncbi:unnamed protein product, partial [Trichobilharzia regenti]